MRDRTFSIFPRRGLHRIPFGRVPISVWDLQVLISQPQAGIQCLGNIVLSVDRLHLPEYLAHQAALPPPCSTGVHSKAGSTLILPADASPDDAVLAIILVYDD